jgi:hypothetical protein
MGDSCAREVRRSTTHRELMPCVIEQPIVVSTGSIVRIESGADAPRKRAFRDERSAVEVPNHSHKV